MPSARSLAPFRSRAFVFVWLGAMVSNIGTWMETTALSFYVAERATASASGLVAAAGFLPGAVLGPVGGAWADRFDRRRIMIAANATAGIVAAFVAVLVASDRATPGNLALCSLMAGCVNALGFPAFQAILPDLVDPEDLVAAIGLSSTSWNLGRIVGPTAAAAAIALGGISTALWTNAASFGAVVLAILLARVTDRRERAARSVLRSVADALTFARTTPAVRSMLPVMAVYVFVAAPFIGLIAQMATNVHHADQSGTSLLVTAQGVGAVVAGASVGSLAGRIGLRRFLVACVGASGPALVLYGAAPGLGLAAIGVLFTGGCYMAALSTCTSVTQRSATSELRGRAMVINNFLLGAAYPAGLMLQARIADAWSLRAVTIASGVGLVGLTGLLVSRRSFTAPIAALG